MTKKFCDCCGEEIVDRCMPIEVPCHHYSCANNMAYDDDDSESNQVSGRYDKIDLCNRCSNKVFASAMKKFFELKGEVTI